MSSACSRTFAFGTASRTFLLLGVRPADLAKRRQHLAGEALHLPELVERAEAADEVVDPRLRERPEPVDDLLRVPDGPQLASRVLRDSSG